MSTRGPLQLSSALIRGAAAILLFGALWIVECPEWAARLGLDCYLFITISYFVLCPGLALVGIIIVVKDVVQHRLPLQAAIGACLAAGLLTWLWTHPPR